jgi:hypothetical protein
VTDAVPSRSFAASPNSLALARLSVGLIQGALLYFLYSASETKSWPATDPYLFAILATIGCAVPILAINALGHLRSIALVCWLVIACMMCGVVAAHNVYRGGFNLPLDWIPLSLLLFVICFVMQSLVIAGQSEGRIIASYPRYFDVSWNLGVQVALALLFVAALWLLLWLGASLFELIKINVLKDLIKKRWFDFPVTTMALAYSLNLTGVRVNLVTGARTLTLTLLSWLLPVMTTFAILFVAALPFVGLELLWATRHAATILLSSTAALVILINAAYREGEPNTEVPPVLRMFRWAASLVIAPLTTLAGYAIWLRVDQYGWSPERVFAAACLVVAICYATGYALAAITSQLSLKPVERTNVLTAVVTVGLLLALLSPIGDPARVSVADQINRLKSGKVNAGQFDYALLRFRTGTYGMSALRQLADNAEGPDSEQIKEQSNKALAATNQFQLRQTTQSQVRQTTQSATPASRASNITVLSPKGASLPPSFLRFNWTTTTAPLTPACLVRDTKCEALLIDLDGDGHDEVLLFSAPYGPGVVFQSDDDENWVVLGQLANTNCSGVREALRTENVEMAAPKWKEIEVAGQRLTLTRPCTTVKR